MKISRFLPAKVSQNDTGVYLATVLLMTPFINNVYYKLICTGNCVDRQRQRFLAESRLFIRSVGQRIASIFELVCKISIGFEKLTASTFLHLLVLSVYNMIYIFLVLAVLITKTGKNAAYPYEFFS